MHPEKGIDASGSSMGARLVLELALRSFRRGGVARSGRFLARLASSFLLSFDQFINKARPRTSAGNAANNQ